MRQYSKEYYKNNKEKCDARTRKNHGKWRKNKMKIDPLFALKITIGTNIRDVFRSTNHHKKNKTEKTHRLQSLSGMPRIFSNVYLVSSMLIMR